MIKFENEHGVFELEIGLRYKFTLLEIESGDVTPTGDAEVVGEDGDSILVKYHNSVVSIEKVTIVQEDLYED